MAYVQQIGNPTCYTCKAQATERLVNQFHFTLSYYCNAHINQALLKQQEREEKEKYP